MNLKMYAIMQEQSRQPAAQEQTIAYLAEHLGRFLKKGERVLICFRNQEEGSLSWFMEQAALRCGAVPVIWGPDFKWKTLLRQAFSTRAAAIIATPLVLLGLTKLIRHNRTPLNIRRVISAGYPCPNWAIEGLVRGFDCEAGGCFATETGIVAGFACGKSWGVHVREDTYTVKILSDEGNILPPGELGEIVICAKEDPSLRFSVCDRGRLEVTPCACGSDTVRVLDINPGTSADMELMELRQQLHSWTSILDCSIRRGDYGLEVELVVFPGEKLPKLPSVARLVIRPWDPETDEPFVYELPWLHKEKLPK